MHGVGTVRGIVPAGEEGSVSSVGQCVLLVWRRATEDDARLVGGAEGC